MLIILGVLIGSAGVMFGLWHIYNRLAYRRCTPLSVVDEKRYHFADYNNTHLSAAKKVGVKPVKTRKQINTDKLAKIESCDAYLVSHLTYSVLYLTPPAKALLQDIAKGFQNTLNACNYWPNK